MTISERDQEYYRRNRRRLAHTLLWGTLLVAAVWLLRQCIGFWGPIDGQVVDSATGEPAAEAIVVARFIGYVGGIEARSACFHVLSTTTNDQGRFHFDPWVRWQGLLGPSGIHVAILTHKAGYRQDQDRIQREHSYRQHRYYLIRDESRSGKRLEYLQHHAGPICGTESDYQALVPLNELILAETTSIAGSQADQKVLMSIKYSVDIVRYGWEVARENQLQGKYKR